jgi:DNA-nicking Smr family endonuclease
MKKRETMQDFLPALQKRRKITEISPEDRAIWQAVAKSIKPLPGRVLPELAAPPSLAVAPAPYTRLSPPPAPIPAKPRLMPLIGLEKRAKREVLRGLTKIDARIDLHGMRQSEAHHALLDFIARAHRSNAKLVLVITGKGGNEAQSGDSRGVLRRLVPHWLADPGLRGQVMGFEAAGLGHGGEGALYVRIRKDRS